MISTKSFVVGSLFSVTIVLVMLGVIMVLSSSFLEENVYRYMGKQLIWFSVGLAGLFFFATKDYNIWDTHSRTILLIALFLLAIALFYPPIRSARRWIHLFGFSFQPSDMAKLAIIFYLSAVWADRHELLDSFRKGVLYPMTVVGILLLLIIVEPDHGTTFFISMIVMVIWFTAGGRLRHIIPIFAATILAIFVALYFKPHLYERIDAYFHPENYRLGTAYQFYSSIVGFAHGGLWGVGIGDGMQKLGFTPEPHTDFIFSTMGEELGFIKCTLVLLAYLWIITLGYLIAMKCTNPFGRLVAVGCTTAIGLQTALNIAVVTGSIPNTGIALPFLSYGGSSLVISMSMIGLLMNIAKDTFGIEDAPVNTRNNRTT
jgi:cell division protein FtsW